MCFRESSLTHKTLIKTIPKMPTKLLQTTFVVLLVAISFYRSNAQDGPSIPYSYDEIIPRLTLLPSGTANAEVVDLNKALTKDSKGDSIIVVTGAKLTMTSIIKSVGSSLFVNFGVKGRYRDEAPKLKELKIYCDTLIIDKSIHVPEADIHLHANYIDMKEQVIRTSPLPLRYSEEANLEESIAEMKKNGVHGKDAGSITIKANQLVNPGTLEANGGHGELRYAPDFQYTAQDKALLAKRTKKIKLGRGCEADMNIKAYNNDIISYSVDNVEQLCMTCDNCKYTKKLFSSTELTLKSDKSLVDPHENKRIEMLYLVNSGNGGNGGVVTVNAEIVKKFNQDLAIEVSKGKRGEMLPRGDKDWMSYEIGSYGFHLYFHSQMLGHYEVNAIYKTEMTLKGFKVMKHTMEHGETLEEKGKVWIPSKKREDFFQSSFDNAWGKDGEDGLKSISSSAIYPNALIYENLLNLIEDQHKKYYMLDDKQIKIIDDKLNWVSDKIEYELAHNEIGDSLRTLSTLHSKVEFLKSLKSTSKDHMGNLPGYRPMLSMQALLSYFKKRLDNDVKMLVLANEFLNEQLTAERILEDIPAAISSVETNLGVLHDDLTANYERQKKLKSEAKLVKKKTEDLKVQIENVTLELTEKAKEKSEKNQLVQNLIKTAAIAINLIPYGQPYLGKFGGQALEALADHVNEGPSGQKSPAGMFSSLNLTSLADSYNNSQKLKFNYPALKLPPKEVDLANHYKTNDEWFNLERRRAKWNIKDITEKYNKAKLKKQKEFNKSLEPQAKKLRGAASLATFGVKAFEQMSVKSNDVDFFLAKLLKADYEYNDLVENIKVQTELKEALFAKLSNSITRNLELQAEMQENENLISRLQQIQLTSNGFDLNSKSIFSTIKKNIIDRLLWAEYNVIKAYEYQTIKEYKPGNSANLESFINTQLDENNNSARADSIITLAFMARLDDISQSVILDIEGTKDYQEVEVYFSLEDKENTVIRDLNSGQSVKLDFYRDFGNMIIAPNSDNIKIKDINIKDVKLENSFARNSNSTLDLVLDSKGIMRNGSAFHPFYTDRISKKTIDSYRWTLKTKNGKNVCEKNETSDQYLELINLIVSNQALKPKLSSLFNYPPAFTTATLKREDLSRITDEFPAITEIHMVVTLENEINEDGKVLDVRNERGVIYPLEVNYNNKQHTFISSLYDVLEDGESVSLSVPESLRGNFKNWTIITSSKTLRDSLDKNSPVLEFDMSAHIRLEPNYHSNEQTDKSVLYTSGQHSLIDEERINVFSSDDGTDVIIDQLDGIHQLHKVNSTKAKEGYVAIYNDFQIAYVKSSSLGTK